MTSITQSEIETRFAELIDSRDDVSFDRTAMALRGRRRKRLHAITLAEAPVAVTHPWIPLQFWQPVWSPQASIGCRGRNRFSNGAAA